MKTYRGRPPHDVTVETRTNGTEATERRALPPRLDLRNHSPTGFSWGYHGSGPSQLALAILADAMPADEELALSLYQRFRDEVVARFNMDAPWTLSLAEVVGWVNEASSEIELDL